ncbi:MAG: YiiX family permuted papain-like enzyme [Bacteroidia bacterium]
MRKYNWALGVLLIAFVWGCYGKLRVVGAQYPLHHRYVKAEHPPYDADIQEGDLIFQTSLSSQSKAIQLATKSQYSHCGLIFKENGTCFVLEAVQPVKKTSLDKWIARGKNGHYVVKRLKNSKDILTEAAKSKMKQAGQAFLGKDYDYTFEWNDDRIYCSELIWKVYKRGVGVEIGKLEKLKDFDLTSQAVKAKLKERYGNKIPYEEEVISPKAVFESELLETIKQNDK